MCFDEESINTEFVLDTSIVNRIFPGYLKEDLYKIFYTDAGQLLSIANFWKGIVDIYKLFHLKCALNARVSICTSAKKHV